MVPRMDLPLNRLESQGGDRGQTRTAPQAERLLCDQRRSGIRNRIVVGAGAEE